MKVISVGLSVNVFTLPRRRISLSPTMHSFPAALLCLLVVSGASAQGQTGTSLCVPPSTAPTKLEAVIEQCQQEIRQAVVEEALQVLGESAGPQGSKDQNRSKRDTESLTGEERRIAGCLLQCVYRRVKAVDESGLPTASGLIRLYSDGVTDRNYFTATIQSVHQCLSQAEAKRRSISLDSLDGGYTCDLAYDMFNCVSDRIEAICGSVP